MIRLPIFNVDSRFAAFVMANEWAAPECCSERVECGMSAEDLFGAVIASHHSLRDRSNLSDQEAVGTMLSSVIPKRSTPDDVEGVP